MHIKSETLRMCRLCLILLIFSLVLLSTVEARRGGRKGGGRRRTGGSRVINRYKNKASKDYYQNENAAKITNWSHFESEYILGRKIVFMCTAQGNPRPHITWYKNGIELYGHSFFQVHEWMDGENILKSKMEIDPATQMDAGYYECQADNKYAVDFKGFRTDYTIEFD